MKLLELVRQKKWRDAQRKILTDPDEINSTDRNGRTPLHLLCMKFDYDEEESRGDGDGADALKFAAMLVDAPFARPSFVDSECGKHFSSHLMARDDFQEIPLHSLCAMSDSSPSLIRLMLSRCSENSHRSVVGSDYLHLSLGDVPSPVELVSAKCMSRCTPLHYISEGRASMEAVDVILDYIQPQLEVGTGLVSVRDNGPHPVMIQDMDGDCPLHFSCSAGGPAKIIQGLLSCERTFPKLSATLYNLEGNLPINDLFIWYEGEVEVYEAERGLAVLPLFKKIPSTNIQHISNTNALTLLHKLWEMVEILLWAICSNPTKLQVRKHYTAVHIAAATTSYPISTLYLAMFMNPSQIHNTTKEGFTPLHVACGSVGPSKNDMDKIKYLSDLAPDSVRALSRASKLPLHIAIERGKNINVIDFLLKITPEVLTLRDVSTRLYLFMLAAVEQNNSIDVVYQLLLSSPELVSTGTTL